MTRRSLLATTAGAMASGLVSPGSVLAALGAPPRPVLEERWLGRLTPSGATIELTRIADLAGVEWRAPAVAGLELRFRDGAGRWSRWVSGAGHGHGPDAAPVTGRLIGDPVWTGGSTAVQLRPTRTLTGVRLHLVDVSGGAGARKQALALGPLALAAALPLATPSLPAGAGQPPIVARRAWAQESSHPRVVPGYGTVRMAFVHHTENPNGYGAGEVPAMLRAIYAFHRYVNGWNDIGYNFVVNSYGRIFEARAGGIDEPVVGAHAGGYNLASTGIAVLGSFMSTPITSRARRALEQLLAWKLSLHGLPSEGRVTVRVNPAGAVYSRFPANARVSLPRVAGHRDGDSTDCPGNVLYGELPEIRARVRRLASRPVRVTLALVESAAPGPRTPGAPGGEPASEVPTLTGSLAFLGGGVGGTPIAGAPIMLQARIVSRKGEAVDERTIAEAVTNAEGRWSLPVSISPEGMPVSLRALCPGAKGIPAAVSDPLHLPGTPVFSPPSALAPGPTPPAASPPAP